MALRMDFLSLIAFRIVGRSNNNVESILQHDARMTKGCLPKGLLLIAIHEF